MTVTTMNPPGTFSWVELGTTDSEKAKTFYGQLFGWDIQEYPMGPGFTYYIFQHDGKDVAAMYQLMDEQLKQGVPAHWMSYVAVNDADDATARATALGAQVMSAPMDVAESGRMSVMKDPQGAVFSVWQAKNHPGVAKRGEPGSLVWNELATTDIKAATDFYSKLFEWTTTVMHMPALDYTVFERDAKGVGGGYQITSGMGPMPSNWLPYFAVSDCDATAALAGTIGAKVMMAPTDIPNVGRFALLTDPAGAPFAILHPMPATA